MKNRLLLPALCAVLIGCRDSGGIVTVDRTGVVAGAAFIDFNADGVFTPGVDAPAPGVVAAVLLEATGDTVARATADATGVFRMSAVPIGRYRLVGARGTLGDSLDVMPVDSAVFSLAAGDTVNRLIRLGYPTATVAAVRAMAAGSRITIRGIALAGPATFADDSLHIADATGAIRAVRASGTPLFAPGDSVRLIGTVGSRNGQPLLTAAAGTLLLPGVGLPPIDSVSTTTAATADGGARDANQVRIGGTISGSQTLPSGDVILTVNDGSGALQVLMDKDVAFNPGPYQPGALLRAAGVLVPEGTGTWRLKPRNRDDANAFHPTVTVAEARVLTSGVSVHISGRALNGRNTFGDATVHLEDATGAIRIIGVPPNPSILAGYSVTILGSLGLFNGQPVLNATSITQVAVGTLTAPDSVSTQVAATADGGARDAGQVAVSGTISAVGANAANDPLLTISDGSGDLVVVLDRDVGFLAGTYVVGDVIRARGVLVPATSGTSWQLKPRALTEVAKN